MESTAHVEAMRMNLRDLVARLLHELGPIAVQAMTGTTDRALPERWTLPDGPVPSEQTARQLRLGYEVWTMLCSKEGPGVASAWLHGANPRLAHDTPITAIRELRANDTVGAAELFVNGTSPG